jgi:hypothetical protein
MYKPGSVVLVNFPFSDLQSAKVRPALVLTAGRDDVIILGIFSKVPEVLRASWVRIHVLQSYPFTVDRSPKEPRFGLFM